MYLLKNEMSHDSSIQRKNLILKSIKKIRYSILFLRSPWTTGEKFQTCNSRIVAILDDASQESNSCSALALGNWNWNELLAAKSECTRKPFHPAFRTFKLARCEIGLHPKHPVIITERNKKWLGL